MAKTIHAVVRTDNMYGTKVGPGLVSFKYLGNDGQTAADIDNGHVVKIEELQDNEREVYVGKDVAANDDLKNVVLVATPEVMYNERLRDLTDYYNEEGKICRGYRFHTGDVFSLTKPALDGNETPEVGNIVELKAGTKLNVADALTSSSTAVGKILHVETVGGYTYYAIKVD